MKMLLKIVVTFAIAFLLLIPLTYTIDTVFTEIGKAADSYSLTSNGPLNVSSEVSNNTIMLSNSFKIVYGLWGISFVIAIIVFAFEHRREDEEGRPYG
jgi:hypothetical protein